jgi:general secretion pathway protein A
MDYFHILNLDREPFANSPDPDFLYRSQGHARCLQQLELAIRLRRGLNVVAGEVGTGKTTLCRELLRRFAAEDDIVTCLVLDPQAASPLAFQRMILAALGEDTPPGLDEAEAQERLKTTIHRIGVNEGRILVLIIDEGQKLPVFGLEILRELLNFETNTHKLLQIVIFAQREFTSLVANHPNFADRINYFHLLGPLGFPDTRALVSFRVQQAGLAAGSRALFSFPALLAIHRATGGYPRRIIHLCHRSLLTTIIQNRPRAGWRQVRACARRAWPRSRPPLERWAGGLLAAGLLAGAALGGGQLLRTPETPIIAASLPGAIQAKAAPAAPLTPQAEAIPARWERQASGSAGPPAEHTPGPPDVAPPPATAASASTPTEAAPLAGPGTAEPPPHLLGQFQVRPGDTLGALIQTVYGHFTPRHLAEVQAANPHVADPDRLEVGTILRIPALALNRPPPAIPTWWLVVASTRSLPEALGDLQDLEAAGLPVRLIPHWNPDAGLRFELVLAECFFEEETARGHLAHLPAAQRATAGVSQLWQAGSLFYRDPYMGGEG